MKRDIDKIIEQVKLQLPDVRVQQHKVKYPGVDDDGLWFFSMLQFEKEIQIESSFGVCPFLVEHDDMESSSDAETAYTVDEAVEKVTSYLLSLL